MTDVPIMDFQLPRGIVLFQNAKLATYRYERQEGRQADLDLFAIKSMLDLQMEDLENAQHRTLQRVFYPEMALC